MQVSPENGLDRSFTFHRGTIPLLPRNRSLIHYELSIRHRCHGHIYQLNIVSPVVYDLVGAKRMAEKNFKGAPFGTQSARYF